jgi:hypothetical protein
MQKLKTTNGWEIEIGCPPPTAPISDDMGVLGPEELYNGGPLNRGSARNVPLGSELVGAPVLAITWWE